MKNKTKTIRIDPGLFKSLKIKSFQKDTQIQVLAEKYIRQGLEKEKEGEKNEQK